MIKGGNLLFCCCCTPLVKIFFKRRIFCYTYCKGWAFTLGSKWITFFNSSHSVTVPLFFHASYRNLRQKSKGKKTKMQNSNFFFLLLSAGCIRQFFKHLQWVLHHLFPQSYHLSLFHTWRRSARYLVSPVLFFLLSIIKHTYFPGKDWHDDKMLSCRCRMNKKNRQGKMLAIWD